MKTKTSRSEAQIRDFNLDSIGLCLAGELGVRRQDGMVDLASPSWGRILRVGLLLCAAVAINCSGGGDVEVENPCFFSTGGPDNSGSQKICAVAGEQTVED